MQLGGVAAWILPIVFAAVGLWLTQRNLGKVGKDGSAKLERLGLHRVAGAQGGSTFRGEYQGHLCGYHWGQTAGFVSKTGGLSAGSEFFVELSTVGPVLAIVQRNDEAWRRFEGGLVPHTEVLTGDPAFDARFRVRCNDALWAGTALTPAVRSQLLAAPLVFLVHDAGRVVLPLYFDGSRLFDDLGVSMKVAWSVFDRADVLLQTAICLADALTVAKNERR